MCLGIPGQIVDMKTDHPDLAMVDVSGVARPVNLGMLSSQSLQVGDWVMIHMGFALERMSPEEAADALEILQALGQGEENDPAFSDAFAESEPPW